MEQDRHIETFIFDWQGITLSVSYEADWLNMGDHGRFGTAHLQVEAVNPPRTPLPITETGYRSHFLPREQIEEHGGPSAFVQLWIEGSATSVTWRTFQAEQRQKAEEDRQLSLF